MRSVRSDALDVFAQQLHPEVVRDIIEWADHPQLGRLHNSLRAHAKSKSFFDRYAEALVARRLIRANVPFRFEVPAPSGKHCDFEITLGGAPVYLHVKRLRISDEGETTPLIGSRLRVLERIKRPYVVSVWWKNDLDDRAMQELVTQASQFIRSARVGDELVVRVNDRPELGGVRIVAPWEGTHVTLAIDSKDGFVDDVPRLWKLMRKAAKQFMPGETNIVLVGSERSNGFSDFETALLGTHIERWDAFPPKGRRIAHGRAPDGFWHGHRYADYKGAGLFRMQQGHGCFDCRLWLRAQSGISTQLMGQLIELLDTSDSPDPC